MKTNYILAFTVFCVVVANVQSIASSDCDLESSTICKFSNQSLACCPVKDASCCAAGEYCCPHGFECDLENNRCLKNSMYIPFYLKMDLIDEGLNVGKDQICPDNETICKEKQTCCKMTAGGYGCCPIKDAHCCDDGVHCCPKNYKCNPDQGKCDRNKDSDLFSAQTIDWFKKEHGVKVNTPCPGGSAECPTGSTCCQLSSGQWGCCPLPNAVCCEDHIHCCPSGYVCDVKDGRCNKQNEFVPFTKKIPAINRKQPAESKKEYDDYSVVCPDGCSFCPNGNTCCKMNDDSYGCCPLPKAVCCEDHLHCCPQNTKCNMKQQTCENTESNYTASWLDKVPSKSKIGSKDISAFQNDPVLCDDGKTQCDPLKVCCKLPDSTYGCCPYVDGICCPGQAYCCPNYMTCSNETGECVQKSEEKPKIEFTEVNKNSLVSACRLDPATPQSSCSANMTSCKNSQQETVCCWYENGICCGKNGLCCPKGYKCDEVNEACQLNDSDDKEATKLGNSGICEDASSTQCDSGCCPIASAVCCSDGLNCCPHGYSCSSDSSEKCVKN